MNFELTTEQAQISEVVREILADACSTPVREPGAAATVRLGATLAETGLAGILVPAAFGGSGATLVEAAILGEALGGAGAAGSVIASTLIGGAALELVRDRDQGEVAEAIVGGRPCAVLVADDLSWPPRGAGDVAWGWLDGSIVLVPEGEELVVARGGEFSPALTVDLGLTVGRSSGEGAATSSTIASSAAGQRFLAATNVVMSSVLLGHMQSVFDAAVAYSSQRTQYGVPIGSFQAIRHLCADMLVDVDASRSATYGAAWAVSSLDDPEARDRSGAVAKAWCSDAGLRVCETALQVHGGIGFTWESEINDHLRATHVARASFMPPEHALDLVAGAASWI